MAKKMRDYLVFGGRTISFVSKDGTEINRIQLFHASLEFEKSSSLFGLEILSLDIFNSDFSLEDFDFPSICSLIKRPVPASGSRSGSRLIDIEFRHKIQFPASGFLLLGCKPFQFNYSDLPPSYKSSKKGLQRGVKLFAIDLESKDIANYQGYLPFDGSIFGGNIKDFSVIPGIYELDFEDVRGANGKNLVAVTAANFLLPYDLLNKDLVDVPLTI